jgi:hypothetical protein
MYKDLSFREALRTYINSGFGLLGVDTVELERAVADIKDFIINDLNVSLKKMKMPTGDEWFKEVGYFYYEWDAVNGVLNLSGDEPEKLGGVTAKPLMALKKILDNIDEKTGGIYIFKNVHLNFF